MIADCRPPAHRGRQRRRISGPFAHDSRTVAPRWRTPLRGSPGVRPRSPGSCPAVMPEPHVAPDRTREGEPAQPWQVSPKGTDGPGEVTSAGEDQMHEVAAGGVPLSVHPVHVPVGGIREAFEIESEIPCFRIRHR